jgi:hypothetical protein
MCYESKLQKEISIMDRLERTVAVLFLLVSIGFLNALTLSAGQGDDLLNFLLIQNEEARRKVATVSYKFEFQSDVTTNVQGAHLPAAVVRGPRSIQMQISSEEFKKSKWRYSSMWIATRKLVQF